MTRALPAAMVVGTLVAGVGPAEAAFPGRNGDLFYTQERGARGKVHTVRQNGKRARAVPRQRYDGAQASVSPDGRRLVFQSYRNGNSELYVMGTDGRGLKRLTRTRRIHEVLPAWSPNGRTIAYQAGRKNSAEQDIYTIGADGRGRRRLTRAPGADTDPAFSPGGSMIAFASNRAGSDGFDVYVMRADGGDQRRLTALPNDEGEPAWSPDGRSLAISAGVFLPTVGAVRDEIFRVNLDGTGLMRLTTNEADDYTPAWSPDGRGIAFVSDRAGSFDVWRMDAATGAAQRRLTTGRGNETHVDWGRRPRRR